MFRWTKQAGRSRKVRRLGQWKFPQVRYLGLRRTTCCAWPIWRFEMPLHGEKRTKEVAQENQTRAWPGHRRTLLLAFSALDCMRISKITPS